MTFWRVPGAAEPSRALEAVVVVSEDEHTSWGEVPASSAWLPVGPALPRVRVETPSGTQWFEFDPDANACRPPDGPPGDPSATSRPGEG